MRNPSSSTLSHSLTVAGDTLASRARSWVVDNLSRAQRAELDEGLELPALLDPQQFPDVPLDVGLHVGGEVQIARGAVFDSMELGESGFEQPSEVVVGWQDSRKPLLVVGESQQIEDGDPAGEGFRDAFHHLEVLGAGQPDRTGCEIARVHELLDGAQETRRVLDLVDGERRTEFPYEQGRVPIGALPCREVIEVDVRMTARALVEQRALSNLARPQQQPHRKEPQLIGRSGQNRLKSPFNPIDWHIVSLLHICRRGVPEAHRMPHASASQSRMPCRSGIVPAWLVVVPRSTSSASMPAARAPS